MCQSCPLGRRADEHAWPAPWGLGLRVYPLPWFRLLLPAPWRQAINASNEPAAHCRLGQMLWERTAFPSTPQRSALEEATAQVGKY